MTDILAGIDATLAAAGRNRLRFDPFGPPAVPRPVPAARPANTPRPSWTAPARLGPGEVSCRGCRQPVAAGVTLCGPCQAAPKCGETRINAITGQRMSCIRPGRHEPPCECGGSQWYPQASANTEPTGERDAT